MLRLGDLPPKKVAWNRTRFRFLGLNAVESPLSSSDVDSAEPGKANSAKGLVEPGQEGTHCRYSAD